MMPPVQAEVSSSRSPQKTPPIWLQLSPRLARRIMDDRRYNIYDGETFNRLHRGEIQSTTEDFPCFGRDYGFHHAGAMTTAFVIHLGPIACTVWSKRCCVIDKML